MRIDVWDVQTSEDLEPIDCGYPRGLDVKYDWGKQLGKGGFGKVQVVTEKESGKEYACKSICKHLDVPNISPQKQAAYLDNIKREISVLRKLRGTLNVAQYKEAYEDDKHVHIIMEYCKGGELWHSIGKRHYSEKTVASYMRAVLRTVAQCHAHRILHRDIKPGNFMLLDDNPLSPVKAIDFGLAVFYDPKQLPRTDLGLEGTPWFMSPEMLSSQVGPPSDVWAAGVMAYQLLSGHLPFDDKRNRDAPALSQVWKAILTEEVSFKGRSWQDISEDAKDFVRSLVNKDASQRPTAREALQHRWLLGGHKEDRVQGPPLRHTVVQRIQRYAQGNVLKRTIFELIAQEILKMAPATPDTTNHDTDSTAILNGAGSLGKHDGSSQEGSRHSDVAAQLLSNIKRRKSQRALNILAMGPGGGAIEGPPLVDRSHHSTHAGMEYYKARGDSVHNGEQYLAEAQEGHAHSLHGKSSYWRVMRAAAQAIKWRNGSEHERSDYLRYMPRCEQEREEQRKAARLALDTSAHASTEYQKFLRQCSSPSLRSMVGSASTSSLRGMASAGNSRHEQASTPQPMDIDASTRGSQPAATTSDRKVIPMPKSPDMAGAVGDGEEQQGRGRSAYQRFVEESGGQLRPIASGAAFPQARDGQAGAAEVSGSNAAAPISGDLTSGVPGSGLNSNVEAGRRGLQRSSLTAALDESKARTAAHASQQASKLLGSRDLKKAVSFRTAEEEQAAPSEGIKGGIRQASLRQPGSSSPRPFTTINAQETRELMRKLNFTKEAEDVSEEALAEGLWQLGYRLQPSEVRMLAEQMDPHNSGTVSKSAFLASQIDWDREDLREVWLAAAKRVFDDLQQDSKGKVPTEIMIKVLREKLPQAEVDYAVEDALVEAGYADAEDMDFDGFLQILRADSMDSMGNLDQYDARLPRPASQDNLSMMYGTAAGTPPAPLPPVAEE